MFAIVPHRNRRHHDVMLRNVSERDDIDRFFHGVVSGMMLPWMSGMYRSMPRTEVLMPQVDVSSDDKAYTLNIEVPGVEPDDVKLTVRDGVLELSGEKKSESEDKEKHVSERTFGSFSRSLTLPEDADVEAITASHKNGVLTVTIPRLAESKQKEKSITIEKA